MARTFFRRDAEGDLPQELVDASTQKVLTPEEFGQGEGFQELEAISGAEFDTGDKQRNAFDNITTVGDTLFGSRKQPTVLPAPSPAAIDTEPIASDKLESTIGAPDPLTFLDTNQGTTFSNKISEVAGTVFKGVQANIDTLKQQQQALLQKQKDLAASQKDDAVAGIKKELNSDQASTALREARDLFEVEENIKNLSNINQQIVNAQEAMNVGLIFEENRPARLQLITGRMATLQKQGLAKIGALQGTAAVIQGNLDLADAYSKSTIEALKEDSDRNIAALNTLLDMASKDLIDLTEEENKVIAERIKAIDDEVASIEKDSDAVISLMQSNPTAFLEGGVTVLDDLETAMKKMLPFLSQTEKDLLEKKLRVAGAGTTATNAVKVQQFKADLLSVKEKGATFEEAVTAFGDVLPISYIRDVYGKAKVGTEKILSPEEILKQKAFGEFLDEDGNIKEGFKVTLEDGKPVVSETGTEGDGFLTSIGNFFGQFAANTKRESK